MRVWAIRIGIVVAVLAAFGLLRATVLKPDPLPVLTAEVGRGRVEETVANSRAGTVKTRKRAMLSPENGGLVVEIPHREGESVQAGDLLLRLDDRRERAQLDLASRDLDAATAEAQRICLTAERAGRELERSRRLAADGILAADLLDEIESRTESAAAACTAGRAGAERSRANVRAARVALDKTELRAPFAGVVAEVSIEVGEWTTPSPPAVPVPPVIDLLDAASIYVSAPMDEVDVGRLAPGQPARLNVDSHRDRDIPGTLTRVAPYVLDVQEQNRTVEVEVSVDDEVADELLPGTSADVEVILAAKEDVVRVPTSALLDGERVLVLPESGILEERELRIGLKNWDYAEVLSGVEPGELIVTSLDSEKVEAGAEATAVDELP